MSTRHVVAGIVCCLAAGLVFRHAGWMESCASARRGDREESRELTNARHEGASTPPDEAARLGRALKRDPEDLLARVRLLSSYYFRPSADSQAARAHVRHVAWTVEHRPGSEAAGLVTMKVDPALNAEGHAQIKVLWLKQVAAHRQDANVTPAGTELKRVGKLSGLNGEWRDPTQAARG